MLLESRQPSQLKMISSKLKESQALSQLTHMSLLETSEKTLQMPLFPQTRYLLCSLTKKYPTLEAKSVRTFDFCIAIMTERNVFIINLLWISPVFIPFYHNFKFSL